MKTEGRFFCVGCGVVELSGTLKTHGRLKMFDAHVNTAVTATQDYLKSIGRDYSFERCAAMFRNAAHVWSDETVLETESCQSDYE